MRIELINANSIQEFATDALNQLEEPPEEELVQGLKTVLEAQFALIIELLNGELAREATAAGALSWPPRNELDLDAWIEASVRMGERLSDEFESGEILREVSNLIHPIDTLLKSAVSIDISAERIEARRWEHARSGLDCEEGPPWHAAEMPLEEEKKEKKIVGRKAGEAKDGQSTGSFNWEVNKAGGILEVQGRDIEFLKEGRCALQESFMG